jgi:hypothetical protein
LGTSKPKGNKKTKKKQTKQQQKQAKTIKKTKKTTKQDNKFRLTSSKPKGGEHWQWWNTDYCDDTIGDY